jgi:hypothetical protein
LNAPFSSRGPRSANSMGQFTSTRR